MGKLTQVKSVFTDADRLRDQIDSCEKALVSLNPETAHQLMLDATSANQILDQLSASGTDVRAEQARLSSVNERISRNARVILGLLGGPSSLALLREQIAPGTQERWWWLDREVAAARGRLLKRLGTFVAVVMVLVGIGYLVWPYISPIVLPPDPVGDAINTATNALAQKDMAAAQKAIDIGLTKVPTSSELLIWKGYLDEKAGNQLAAQTEYSKALVCAGSEKLFLLQRAIEFVRVGEYQRVLTDTNELIAKYPNYAEAYYIRASGYEGLHQNALAIVDLQKCGDLAQAQGNDALYAESRVRLATLMQASQ